MMSVHRSIDSVTTPRAARSSRLDTATAAGGGEFEASASRYSTPRFDAAPIGFPERVARLTRVSVASLIDIDAVENQSENPLPIQNLEDGLDIGLTGGVCANDHHHAIAETTHGLGVR